MVAAAYYCCRQIPTSGEEGLAKRCCNTEPATGNHYHHQHHRHHTGFNDIYNGTCNDMANAQCVGEDLSHESIAPFAFRGQILVADAKPWGWGSPGAPFLRSFYALSWIEGGDLLFKNGNALSFDRANRTVEKDEDSVTDKAVIFMLGLSKGASTEDDRHPQWTTFRTTIVDGFSCGLSCFVPAWSPAPGAFFHRKMDHFVYHRLRTTYNTPTTSSKIGQSHHYTSVWFLQDNQSLCISSEGETRPDLLARA